MIQTLYSGFPAALAKGGTFDLEDPVSQWWLSSYHPETSYSTTAAFRLIANVSSSAVDITTITRYTDGYAVVWQNRIEGSFQLDANNARASGTPTVTYQSYTSWNSDGSRGTASYRTTTHASGPPVSGIDTSIWSRYFEQNSKYQSTQFVGASNTSSGTFTNNGDGTGTWSLDGGESGTFQVTDYTVNSDSSISYRQRFLRSNGSTYGEAQGRVQGVQGNNSGQYSGTWRVTENNGTKTFRNFRSNGVLVSTGSFQPLSAPTYSIITDTSAPTNNVSNTYAKNLVGDVLTGAPKLTQNSFDAKFHNLGGGRYGVQQKGKSTIDEITGVSTLSFNDKSVSISSDIKGVFDQVTGKETKDAQMYRLYNAAFARFPDADGLKFWINSYSSGAIDYKQVAQSFLSSPEFASKYGVNNSNNDFVNNLYKNILGRSPDSSGLQFWVNTLNRGVSSRADVLGGFSESPENKNLFSQTTGFT